ncbi:ATP-binding cassette, subfamily B [Streptomyces sp. cf386]|uniref:ABC transporter ATP-binding protein n=1 Tax=Streptomyces sp. cf386 TaxID=1761904 RepID=UPI00088DF8F9|nr:ATP-binding cassette, subfamily B [Streptomyces sp. cf386]
MLISQGPGGITVGDPNSSDSKNKRQSLRPGTVRRALTYIQPHRRSLLFLLLTTVVDSLAIVATPLLLKEIIDEGILKDDLGLVIALALTAAGLAVVDAVMQLGQSYFSGRIGQGVSHDLRVQTFTHVQRQPMAFFTRTQTGLLTSRLNADVMLAQQALGLLLTSVTSVLTVFLVLAEMFYLSWLISLIAVALLPLFVVPGIYVGRRLQRYSREQMQSNAELAGVVQERFNVSGAMLAKLYGRPKAEADAFSARAGKVRDVGVKWTVFSRLSFISMGLLAALATSLVYGAGGALVLDDVFRIGTLVALAVLLGRLYGPITQLSGMQANALTALVSFDRLFELLDLKPLIEEKPGATPLAAPGTGPAPRIEFDQVSFGYPRASEVSLASLESNTQSPGERSRKSPQVLHELSFELLSGQLTALVGPSGGGKTTMTHLVSRLYDPTSGVVRMDGHDLRDVTLDSLRDTVGVVTQDAHFYHDTIRANLLYARPEATEEDLMRACDGAQIGELIRSLPSGLDTVVGDRGYRLSGGEKQRLALARLMLKAPSVVILDEATAHLDSESEAAVQRALTTALRDRTSLVIAHRLSTIREADQILVIDGGRVRERGTHEELLAAGELYAELYRTQFDRPAAGANGSEGHLGVRARAQVMTLGDGPVMGGGPMLGTGPMPGAGQMAGGDGLVLGGGMPPGGGGEYMVRRRGEPDEP